MITIMLDRPGIRARGPTSPPSTSPTITVRTTAIHTPCHISTTRVTLHLRPKQSHILQKLQTHGFVKEQACEEHRVRSSIFRQHRTFEWQPRGEGCSPQSCFVFHYDQLYTFHHYVRFWAQRKLAQRRHICNGWRSLAMEDVRHYGNVSGSTLENGIAWSDYSATRVSQSPVCPLLCSWPKKFWFLKLTKLIWIYSCFYYNYLYNPN